jgi:hypothetical protein
LPLIVTSTPAELSRTGPIVKVEISDPSDPSSVAVVNALIDTGAAFSAINPRLAESCRLVQRSQKKIHVAGDIRSEDAKEYPEFAASIRFPNSDLQGFRVHGIVACPIFERQFSCLIGRDILRSWELTYSEALGQFSIRDARNEVSEFD